MLESTDLFSLRHIHPPAAVLLASLHVLLRQQLIQQLLDSCHTDARHLTHVCQRKHGLRLHRVQNLRVIRRTELRYKIFSKWL